MNSVRRSWCHLSGISKRTAQNDWMLLLDKLLRV